MKKDDFQEIKKAWKNTERISYRERMGIPEKVDSFISCSIPYAIPIMDDNYEIQWQNHSIDFELKRIQKNMPPKNIISGPNFYQRPLDKYGISSISVIRVKIPWFVDPQEKDHSSLFYQDSIRTKAKEMLVDIINVLVDKVRYFLEEFWMEQIRYQDIEHFSIEYKDNEKSYGSMSSFFDTGIGGVIFTGKHPFIISQDKQNDLKKLLRKNTKYDLSKILLMNVENECLKGDYRHALIESVIALEYTLYKFVRNKGKKHGISKKKMDEFIKTIGLKECLSTLLKIMVEEKKLPDKSDIEKCKGGITIRNNIVHKGHYDLDPRETERQIIAIRSVINQINQIM